MTTSVCKFGGSSLSDADMFRRVIDIVRSDPARRFVVLSAPGKRFDGDQKITDLLYAAHLAGPYSDQSIFSRICQRYTQIAAGLCPNFNMSSELANIREMLHCSADFAASRGEYLSAKLFAAASGFDFVDASELICFHGDGSIDMTSTRECVQSRLSSLDRVVIPGFYGSLPDGSIKTFSRGGSDVSGAVIAAALDADLYENWTDVDGLFTADPRLIHDARRNPLVSLDQMQAVARAGANVLHPDSLSVLRGTGIDALIKSTFDPGGEGTRISENCTVTVPCVTAQRNLARPLLARDGRSACNDASEYCVISAFGLDSTAMRCIHHRLKPICIIHMQDHYKIITPNDRYETAIHIIHRFMLH